MAARGQALSRLRQRELHLHWHLHLHLHLHLRAARTGKVTAAMDKWAWLGLAGRCPHHLVSPALAGAAGRDASVRDLSAHALRSAL